MLYRSGWFASFRGFSYVACLVMVSLCSIMTAVLFIVVVSPWERKASPEIPVACRAFTAAMEDILGPKEAAVGKSRGCGASSVSCRFPWTVVLDFLNWFIQTAGIEGPLAAVWVLPIDNGGRSCFAMSDRKPRVQRDHRCEPSWAPLLSRSAPGDVSCSLHSQ